MIKVSFFQQWWIPSIFQHIELLHFLPILHSKYRSTLSSPQCSFTTGMVAGTSNWNVELNSSLPLQERSCFLASLIAPLVAQWTEAAKIKGGSPEAAQNSFWFYTLPIDQTTNITLPDDNLRLQTILILGVCFDN